MRDQIVGFKPPSKRIILCLGKQQVDYGSSCLVQETTRLHLDWQCTQNRYSFLQSGPRPSTVSKYSRQSGLLALHLAPNSRDTLLLQPIPNSAKQVNCMHANSPDAGRIIPLTGLQKDCCFMYTLPKVGIWGLFQAFGGHSWKGLNVVNFWQFKCWQICNGFQ